MQNKIFLIALAVLAATLAALRKYSYNLFVANKRNRNTRSKSYETEIVLDKIPEPPVYEPPRTEPVYNTREELEKLFAEADLGEKWPLLKPIIKDDVQLDISETDNANVPIGASKIGGLPDLPEGWIWDKDNEGKSMSFLAQLNLAEIATHDVTDKLPKKGMLYFFYDSEQSTWGYDTKDRGMFKVLYNPNTSAILTQRQYPDDIPDYARYTAAVIAPRATINLPSLQLDVPNKLFTEAEEDTYSDLRKSTIRNKLLGYAEEIQSTMEKKCALVTNGLYVGDGNAWETPEAQEIINQPNDWILLLQLDSNEGCGMFWGDGGMLYFWIKEADLRQQNFDNVWLILQCY